MRESIRVSALHLESPIGHRFMDNGWSGLTYVTDLSEAGHRMLC
jgi:hypothetical protein